MEEINLGIEISEGVKKTNKPIKIERYDFIPQKQIKNISPKPKTSRFYGYRPGMSKYRIGGDADV